MRKIGILSLIAAGLIVGVVLVACGSTSTQPTQAPSSATPAPGLTQAPPPALDGAALLEARCSVCHSVDRAKQAHKTLDQWDQTVTRMIGHGAQLTDAEKAALVDYLAKTYGP
jgi:cytochrome c5